MFWQPFGQWKPNRRFPCPTVVDIIIFYDSREFELCYLSWWYESHFGAMCWRTLFCLLVWLLSNLFTRYMRPFTQHSLVKTEKKCELSRRATTTNRMESLKASSFTNWKSTVNGNGLTAVLRQCCDGEKTSFNHMHANVFQLLHTCEPRRLDNGPARRKYQLTSTFIFITHSIEKLERISYENISKWEIAGKSYFLSNGHMHVA